MKNREYVIYSNKGKGVERIVKTESELTQHDLDLYFGHIINEFDKLPPIIKSKFKNYIDIIFYTSNELDNDN